VPELPEVETIVRALQNGGRGSQPLPGRQVESANLLWGRTLAEPGEAEFLRRLPGQTVQRLSRRAKLIQRHFDRDTLLIHLRMSGDLRVEPASAKIQKHDRLLLNFTDGLRLAFNDTRKFGRAWLTDDPSTLTAGLGPEPLDEDFTPSDFHSRLQTSQRQLKPLLLDQTFLAGLGNIYTDEALHRAGLHPLTPANWLEPAAATRLLEAIRVTLLEGIRRNGASIDWVYRGGDFQNYFRVYGRSGQPCPVCGTSVERIIVGQRSTHFCPVCQPQGA
jgi:formamidopyrimidine-DNA glycosylase